VHASTLSLQRSSQYYREVIMCKSDKKSEVCLDGDAQSPFI